ncbi:Histone transcription regulator 3 [Coemansia sp. RSA 2399]|nr:Histone transcription regulator 3 [Coemansia sp. RSA 2399]
MTFTHVEYKIDQAKQCDSLSQKAQLQVPDEPYVAQDSNIVCNEPAPIATKDVGNDAADSLDVGEQTANITPNNATSSINMIDDDDNLAASADDSSNNDSGRGIKRLGSHSEDEMPDCSSSTGSSDDRYKTNRPEPRYFDSLKPLFQIRPSSVADRPSDSDSSTLSNHYNVTIDECRHILESNCGAMDLLTRYFSKLVEIFYSSPVRFLNSPRLMRVAFSVATTFHEPFLDRVHRMLSASKTYEDHSLAIRCAAFMLLVFTNGLIEGAVSDASAICSYMRGALIRLVGDATTVLGLSTDDSCILQYQFVESWTSYETGIVSNNTDSAQSSIVMCQKLMEEALRKNVDISVARCSFSGVPVTSSLILQRRQHICIFFDLHRAETMASSGDGRAAALLKSAIKPFSGVANGVLAFPQTISAIRLLASLHRQAAEADEEALLIMYELFIYTSQMLDHSADALPIPLKLIISHCVDCLQRIRQLFDDNSSVYHRLAALCSNNSLQQLAAQAVALPLGFISYFRVDPPVDSPPSLIEARYIGLSLWLAAVLTSVHNSVCESSTPSGLSVGETVEFGGISDDDAKVPSDEALTGSPSDNETLDSRVQLMGSLHSLLGERGLCTSADGALLLQLLSTCRERLRFDQGNDVYWDMAAACLRCLFDIKLHGSNIEAHHCAHIEMDKEAANLVFALVESELLATLRSRKGAGLRSDLKAIVDKTSSVLGDIDTTKYPRLSMNIDAIDDYLDGPSMPLFAQVEQALCADNGITVATACLPITKGISNVLPAHRTLPFVRAVTQHDLLLSRMRSGLSRAVEEYDNIIEDYKLNVALNPDSAEAWYQLGQAHSDLADELLLGTASEILSSRYDIAILQRSAISCVVQAKQLILPSLHAVGSSSVRADSSISDSSVADSDESVCEDVQKLRVRIYLFTACLLYRIASKPLPLLAFQILPSNILVSDDNVGDERQEWDVGVWKPTAKALYKPCSAGDAVASITQSLTRRFTRAPPSQKVYSLACRLLAVASRSDTDSWKSVYMLGKAMAKLSDPLSACACYLKAVYLAIASDGKLSGSATASLSCPAYTSAPASAGEPGSAAPAETSSHPIPMSSVPESAISAIYKLLSTLAKLLHSSSLDVETVTRFIGNLPFAAANVPDRDELKVRSGSDSTDSGRVEVFKTIYRLASQVCATDRRRWHHRLVFMLAWIEHNVLKNPDQAKQTLQTVLQTRSSNRLLSSFYKPDFEAPGKHYLYLEKYICLYVETLVATSDIEGVQILLRKLKRCSGMFFDISAMQLRVKAAEISTLNKMVHRLNCPKFVVDNLGKEHIVLQNALDEDSVAKEYSVTRHCRLNRTQFNCARDFARDNISFYVSFSEHISNVISKRGTAEDAAVSGTSDNPNTSLAVVKSAQQMVDRYLDTATKAMTLFDILLEKKKKHFDDAETLSKLNDNLADLYILILSTYGQERLNVFIHPLQDDDLGELANMCSRIISLISSSQDPKTTGGVFWQRVLFDEANNESSQQYKLLDPLLEFNVNKLLDSVRDARSLQPNPFVRNISRSSIAQVSVQPAPQPTATSASAGGLHQPQQQPPAT